MKRTGTTPSTNGSTTSRSSTIRSESASDGGRDGSSWDTAIEPVNAVRDEWHEIGLRSGTSPFRFPFWVEAWFAAFGRGDLVVRTIRHRADGRLAAILPLQLLKGAVASPTNWHTPDFGPVVEGRAAAAALAGAVLDDHPRRIALGFLTPDEADHWSTSAEERGSRVIRRTIQRSPTVPLEGTWEDYEKRLGRKVRSELRRRHRLLSERGEVRFEVTGPEDLEARLEEGLRVEASGWKGSRGTAILADPRVADFYRRIAREAAALGWLRLAFLRLGDQAIAFDLALQHGGRHYLVKTGFDPEFRTFAPGKLLRREMLSRAYADELEHYEFLGADAPWKQEWRPEIRPRELIQAFDRSPLGALDWTLYRYGRPFAKRVRDVIRERGKR